MRWSELLILFGVAPGLCAWLVWKGVPPFDSPQWLFPVLWLWAAVSLVLLLCDRGFDRRNLWRWSGLRWRSLRHVAIRSAVLGPIVIAFVAVFYPDRLFEFPREHPGVWLLVMLTYPIASVYAQELIFRTMFDRRFAPLFGSDRVMVAVNALAFGWVHVVFLNPVAIGWTLLAGWLFMDTYKRTQSTAAACFEHALFGCFVFTVGLGRFFYAGAVNV